MLTSTQKTWLLIAPRISSLLSICGSSWIISNISRDKRKGQNTHHRILVAMSIYDIVFSLSILVGTIAMPKDPSLAGTFGNMTTCEMQGFFIILGGIVPIYNAFLGINAVLLVRYNTNSRQMKKLERYGHILAALWALTMALTALLTDSIAPSGGFCYYQRVPEGCHMRGDCVRGESSFFLSYVYLSVSYVLSFIVAVLSMIILFVTVHARETTIAKYRMSNQDIRKKSKRIAKQALLYLACFFFSFFFSGIYRVAKSRGEFAGNKKLSFSFYVGTIMYPLQGFLNFLVYWSTLTSARNLRRRWRDSDVWSRVQSIVTPSFRNVVVTENNSSDGVRNDLSRSEHGEGDESHDVGSVEIIERTSLTEDVRTKNENLELGIPHL